MQDFVAKTWTMYFDGTNIFAELGFRDNTIAEFSRFSFTGKWGRNAWLDDVGIDTNRPSGLTD
jgi:hypothetical protein